ncbi:MAG: dTDP-6-deoxy-3,4-keto-hexulose isomerase [Verrucomicrobiota bacterium]|jgi:dTDP-4-dehydrorhamnose 3,5-epimerase-like enzyme
MADTLATILPFIDRSDARGGLSIIEEGAGLPFRVRRAYWVYGTSPGVSRGFHAHRQLQQICFCVAGSVRMELFDGRREESVQLKPGMGGLMLPPMLWHEMHDFSADCVLTVLADAEYDESDYIRDRDQFIRHVHSS